MVKSRQIHNSHLAYLTHPHTFCSITHYSSGTRDRGQGRILYLVLYKLLFMMTLLGGLSQFVVVTFREVRAQEISMFYAEG